jgi:hypothetical protein
MAKDEIVREVEVFITEEMQLSEILIFILLIDLSLGISFNFR